MIVSSLCNQAALGDSALPGNFWELPANGSALILQSSKNGVYEKIYIDHYRRLAGFGHKRFHTFSEKREPVDFPEGFRQWTHIKSHVVGPNNPAAPKYSGFTSYYANDKAMQGYRTNVWPDGAIIVVDVLESIEKSGDYAMSKRKFIDVMVKDSKKYAATGGWGFEEFWEGDKTKAMIKEEAAAKCFNCHKSRAGERIVFTKYAE